jgi:sensor histidine kinase YesM
MKVKWREHGFILVTLLTLITIAADINDLKPLNQDVLAVPYMKAHIPFNHVQNILMPQIGVVVLLYLLYLWINKLTVPMLLRAKNKRWAYVFVVLQWLLISYLLALGVNIGSYYGHPAILSYWAFNSWSFFGYNDKPLQNLFFGFDKGLILFAVYAVYLTIREYIIYRVENSTTRKPYRVLIINQATLCATIYILILWCFKDTAFSSVLYGFVIPAIFIYFSNMYWLFPSKKRFELNAVLVVQLVLTAVIYTTLFLMFFARQGRMSYSWRFLCGFQLLITTPVTWLLYQQQKDKILRLRNAEKNMLQSRADLQFLRSQINPHFLFNALNTLYGTALLEGSKNTAEGIQKLGDMMRFMLHENTLDFIPMEKEIGYLKNYIALQKLRIQTSPDIIIEDNITTEHCAHQIVPMLLIPFVENAFKHGISLSEKSWIKIKLVCDDDGISFEVRNSLPQLAGNDPEKEQSGIGIINVQERLQILYPNRHQFTYGVEADEFAVRLNLQPIITK